MSRVETPVAFYFLQMYSSVNDFTISTVKVALCDTEDDWYVKS